MSPVSRLTNAKMIRGGGGSLSLHGFDADKKNGPASEEPRPSMRMNASWFGSPRGSTDYKAVASESLRLGRLASDRLGQSCAARLIRVNSRLPQRPDRAGSKWESGRRKEERKCLC
jgi:hypothetical protein